MDASARPISPTCPRRASNRRRLAHLTAPRSSGSARSSTGTCRRWKTACRADKEALVRRHPDLAEPLAAYLKSLDALHDAAAGFGGASQPAAPRREDASDERRLGDFKLIREIGRGGMGVVYEAQQISLDRRVALKILPFAAVLDAKQIARFKNEAHAAAQLDHPNIVPVFAVGVERGVHYYAMRLVDGQPLDRAIAELRRDGTTQRRRRARSPAPAIAPPQPKRSSTPSWPTVSRRTTTCPRRRTPRCSPGNRPTTGVLPHGHATGDSSRRSPARGPRVRHRPSRRQTLESALGRRRQALGDRLRPGPIPDRRHRDPHRRPPRDGAVHEPGAGVRQDGVARSPDGHLFAGGDALRVARVAAGVRRRRRRGPAAADPAGGAGAAAAVAAAGSPRPGNRRPQGDGEAAGATATRRPGSLPRTCSGSWTASRPWPSPRRSRNGWASGPPGTAGWSRPAPRSLPPLSSAWR